MATIRQRDGRWQAIIRRTDLKATKTFDLKKDAEAWARGLERKADLGEILPGKLEGTLGPIIDRYEQKLKPVKRWGRNKENELSALRKALGGHTLKSLTAGAFLRYAQGLKLSPGGVQARLSYLREVFRTAHDLWEMRVPLEALDEAIQKARENKIAGRSGVRTRRPTEEEIVKLLAYKPPGEMMIDLVEIIRILSVLPLRLGELLGIGWPDLIEKRRTVILRGRKNPDFRVKEQSEEEVPLIAFGGVDTFDQIWNRPRYLPSPFPYKPNSVSQAFMLATLRCGIKDLHLHDFRAYSLSRLLEAGVPLPQVALISGHKNWKVLSRHYARIDPVSVHATIARTPQPSSAANRRARRPRGKGASGPP